MVNKLPEEWFLRVSKDKDDLERIIDYLEPTLYYGFIDLDDEAYKLIRNKLLGIPYTESPCFKEEAEITRYNLGASEEKAMLVGAQEARQILDEVKLAFLADSGILDGQVVQTIIPYDFAFQTEDLDTYDFDCDDISNAKAVLMANISNYGSDVISEANIQDTNLQAQQDLMILSVIEQMSEQIINHVNNREKANKEKNNELVTAELERYKERVKIFEQHLNINLSSREKMIDFEMDDMIKEKLALKEQVDSPEKNLSKQIKEK
nr:hypothetical protein [Tanacetum cinerariifolium]